MRASWKITVPVVSFLFAAASAACVQAEEPAEDSSTAQGVTAAAADPTVPTGALPQIVAAGTLAKYKSALPKVAYPKLEAIFESPSTVWFDKETMIPSYQDSVGDGSQTPIGARANSQGAGVIVPQGRRLFSQDGKSWAFPFAHTAGTDTSTNLQIVNFMSLPANGASFWPVVYRRIQNPQGLGGLGVNKWTWTYPKGTVLGEVLMNKDAQGNLTTSEIRIRIRYASGWGVNVFRPFPTAESLSVAIKAARPNWATQPNLKAVVDHLGNNATLEPKSQTSPGFNNVFQVSGNLDKIPDFQDEALVKELLTKTVFTSAYGEAWKQNGTQKAFAAASKGGASIVPNNYEAGLLEVREKQCMECHKNAGQQINDFEPNAVLYGDIWGEDGIFSFHPYDQSQYTNFNNENRRVRPEYAAANMVVPYNPATHPSDRYTTVTYR